jgi:hypothetical protein
MRMRDVRKTGAALGSVLSVAIVMSFSGNSMAAASEDVFAAIVACKAIANDTARLRCLDTAVANVGSKSSDASFGLKEVRPASDAFSAANLPAKDIERDDDGDVEAIASAVRKWSYDASGRITVELENGQVWRQVDDAQVHLAKGVKTPHRVRIARASFGSFTMTVNGLNKGYKVRRFRPAAG